MEVRGFKELAMYHQARVAQNRGEKDKAKELLLSLKERLNKTEERRRRTSRRARRSRT